MEKNNRELLIKEISSRLPYGVKAQVLGWDEEKGEIEVPLRVYSINTDGYVYFETNDYDVNYLAVDECLLYLRSMSSMTEEEMDELESITFPLMEKDWDGNENPACVRLIDVPKYMNFILSNHFDFMGLIPKGLAIEVTEENNPYKE